MTEFLSITIVGAVVSAAIELITRYYGTNSTASKLIAVGLSIVVGLGYTFLSGTVWWTTILGVLASASTVYALIIPKS